jgi:SAM-dependent methyltransferase
MTEPFEVIDGIRCYAPELARSEAGFPAEGFDVTAELEAKSFWVRTRNRVLHRVFERFTPRDRRLDVLEIGCGIGGVIRELRTIPNLRLTGSEVFLRGLQYARERIPEVGFIQLDATRIPFHEEYDVIGAFDVIEHIEADERVLGQVRGALRAGGLLVVTVPQYPWMWSRLDEVVHHKRRYRRPELRAKLERAGFEVIYLTSFVTTLFPLMVAQRILERARKRNADARAEYTAEVSFPGFLNTLFDAIMRVDELLLRAGLTLPFGGSLLAVARRR